MPDFGSVECQQEDGIRKSITSVGSTDIPMDERNKIKCPWFSRAYAYWRQQIMIPPRTKKLLREAIARYQAIKQKQSEDKECQNRKKFHTRSFTKIN